MKRNTQNKGITLVALVVTIVVLLILANISIVTLFGENGIITITKKADEEWKMQSTKEQIELAIIGSYDVSGKLDINKLKEELEKIENIDNIEFTNDGLPIYITIDEQIYEITETLEVKRKDSYLVKYNGNGNTSGEMSAQKIAIGEYQKLIKNQYEKIGYEFAGWSIQREGAIVYQDEQTVRNLCQKKGEEIELFAVWKIPGLKIGDIIEYSPTGTYQWQAKYYSYGVSDDKDITISSSSNEKFHLKKWRVLNINSDGTIECIAESPTTGTVPLRGSQGYNNGVLLLNSACSALYSNSTIGIEARNIKLEDIIAKSSKEYKLYDETIEIASNGTYYPPIFAQEYGSALGGNLNTTGLRMSEQNLFIEPSNDWDTYGRLTATSVGSYNRTGAWIIELHKGEKFEGPEIYNEIFHIQNGNYWLATRACTSNQSGMFGILMCSSYGITIQSKIMMGSINYYKNNKFEFGLFPVISFSEDLVHYDEIEFKWKIQ